MKQYKVIAGACPCMEQNKILDAGDIVDEDFFFPGQIEERIKGGFIEEIFDEKEEKPVKKK